MNSRLHVRAAKNNKDQERFHRSSRESQGVLTGEKRGAGISDIVKSKQSGESYPDKDPPKAASQAQGPQGRGGRDASKGRSGRYQKAT